MWVKFTVELNFGLTCLRKQELILTSTIPRPLSLYRRIILTLRTTVPNRLTEASRKVAHATENGGDA